MITLNDKQKARFLDKIQFAPATQCWEWTGAKQYQNYGLVKLYGHTHLAHRIAYEIFRSEIPANKILMHTCDNPSCVNPFHLRPGTTQQNTADKIAKGRTGIPGPKFSTCAATRIRRQYANSKATMYDIALAEDTSINTIIRIVHRQSWPADCVCHA